MLARLRRALGRLLLRAVALVAGLAVLAALAWWVVRGDPS